MTQTHNSKPYDLEDRTLEFAKKVRTFVKRLSKTFGNIEDIKQLLRASGSIGANYIEANEALGKKDFLFMHNDSNQNLLIRAKALSYNSITCCNSALQG